LWAHMRLGDADHRFWGVAVGGQTAARIRESSDDSPSGR
jgi:hypothetical protein